jgi:hypothetical protein
LKISKKPYKIVEPKPLEESKINFPGDYDKFIRLPDILVMELIKI